MEALPQRVKAPLIIVFIAPSKVMLWVTTAVTLGLFDLLVSIQGWLVIVKRESTLLELGGPPPKADGMLL